ncbi:MAG: hypothetical protein JSV79_04980, partial [Armatimonadota bacterium]
MARPRYKRAPGIDRPWFAFLVLLPWALLMAGGGVHNHGFAVTDRAAASDSAVPVGAPRLQQDSAASPRVRCIACLWQLQSGAASYISPDTPAEPVALFRALACESYSRGAEGLSFDP